VDQEKYETGRITKENRVVDKVEKEINLRGKRLPLMFYVR